MIFSCRAANGWSNKERELSNQFFNQDWSCSTIKKEAITIFKFTDDSEEVHRQRSYDLSKVGRLVTQSGLLVVHMWSWFNKRPYNTQSASLFF